MRSFWRREHQKVLQQAQALLQTESELIQARADELKSLRAIVAARRVEKCAGASGKGWQCHTRECPSCAKVQAAGRASTVERKLRRQPDAFAVVVTLVSQDLDDLSDTFVLFRKLLPRLRRHPCFKNIHRGVGGLEMKRTRNGRQWNVHAHLAFIAREVDLEPINAQWDKLARECRRRGSVVNDKKSPPVRNIAAFAKYATKSDDWCPRPASMPVHEYGIIRRAIKGRRLLVEWGFRKQPRRGCRP